MAENMVEQQLSGETPAFGLTAFCTALVLILTLLAIARFLGKKFISGYLHKLETCFQSTNKPQQAEPRQPEPQPIEPSLHEPPQPQPEPIEPPQPEPKEINKEYVKNEIKTSIEDFRSMKAAVKMVRSIEENLKEMKSQNINVEEVTEMEIAIQPAIKALESIEKIINKGVWLLGQF